MKEKKTKNHWDVKDVLFEWEKAAAGALQHQHLFKKKKLPLISFNVIFCKRARQLVFVWGGEVNRRQKSFFFNPFLSPLFSGLCCCRFFFFLSKRHKINGVTLTAILLVIVDL